MVVKQDLDRRDLDRSDLQSKKELKFKCAQPIITQNKLLSDIPAAATYCNEIYPSEHFLFEHRLTSLVYAFLAEILKMVQTLPNEVVLMIKAAAAGINNARLRRAGQPTQRLNKVTNPRDFFYSDFTMP